MGLLWWIIGILLVIVWIATVYDVLHRHLGGQTTALWIVAILVLPFVGAILYWALRKPPADEVERAYQAGRDIRRTPPRL